MRRVIVLGLLIVAAIEAAALCAWVFLLWYLRVPYEVDLFVMAGQSNMKGWAGNAEEYPPDRALKDLRVIFYYARLPVDRIDVSKPANEKTPSDKITAARRMISRVGARVFGSQPMPVTGNEWTNLGPQWGLFPKYGHFGPEITFSRDLLDAGLSPAIFKYAKEGTSLARDWKGPGEQGLYDHFTTTLKESIAALVATGHRPRVRAVVWIQGESDAADRADASAYLSHLATLIQHLRKEVLMAEVPIILGAFEDNRDMRRNPGVINAQETLAKTMRCVARSSMRGLPRADWTHLTPDGIAQHGHRLFEAYQQIAGSCQPH